MKKLVLPLLASLVITVGFSQKADTLKIEKDDKVFTLVESPAEFPGGAEGWRKYLEQNMTYPKKALRKNIQGLVRIQFIVGKDGSVSEVQALNDPGGGLAEEAIRLISESPKWKPAEQNKRKVIYRHIQSITFKLE